MLTNHPVVAGASAESSWTRLPLSLRLGHAASNGREPSRRRETHWRTKVEAAAALEQAALNELRNRGPDRAIETNVEFWAAR